MSTRGWDGVTSTDIARMQRKDLPQAKPSKYRNVKVEIQGEKFDSKREATYWLGLKAREAAGEITDLRRQAPYDLLCPDLSAQTMFKVVATYFADFEFRDKLGTVHVVDAKGKRTQMYLLKRKWLELQTGIQIEEV